MADDEKTMEEYNNPQVVMKKAIVIPAIEAESYEINPGILEIIIQHCQFGGDLDEDPYLHIQDFLLICDTFRLRDVSEDAVRLRLFPLSLRDKAKAWLRGLPANSITTWDQLFQTFLRSFNPPFKTANEFRHQQPESQQAKKKNSPKQMMKCMADQERSNDQINYGIRSLEASIDSLAMMLTNREYYHPYYNFS